LAALITIPIIYFGRIIKSKAHINQEYLGALGVSLEESLGSPKTLYSMGAESWAFRRYKELGAQGLQFTQDRIRARSMLIAGVIFMVFSAVAFILWVGAGDVFDGEMTTGALSSFIFYGVVVGGSLGALSEIIGDLNRAQGAGHRLLEILHEKPLIINPLPPSTLSPPENTPRIRFENVTFAYPTRPDFLVLDNVSFTIEPGEIVAFSGQSGAGKSTILNLLMRFYDPNLGAIYLDDKDIKTIPLKYLRRHFGVILQDVHLISGTIEENLRYGRKHISDRNLIDAVTRAQALPFIESLPFGFKTPIGDKGQQLSGGQRQRLALARALLGNPKVLILDEATNAVDVEQEQCILRTLKETCQDQTLIMVAHSPFALQSAQRNLIIDDCLIKESSLNYKDALS
jgi:ATP-binding cassette subfamily B protein